MTSHDNTRRSMPLHCTTLHHITYTHAYESKQNTTRARQKETKHDNNQMHKQKRKMKKKTSKRTEKELGNIQTNTQPTQQTSTN